MKIYIAHARKGDYRGDLYEPLKESALAQQHTLVFPHEEGSAWFDSKPFIMNECDAVIAEVSEPATGLGIELGWANVAEVPIIGVYRSGAHLSSSVRALVFALIEYTNEQELVSGIAHALDSLEK